jgi:release factor glutamine methyltransferase
MTVLETIQKGTDYLSRKGVESPRLQSESILAYVLGQPRMQLYLNFQRELSEPQVAECRRLIQRRAARVPLQHLVGSVSFGGLEIRVGPEALIPRPETEQLVEHAVAFLNTVPSPTPAVLDWGTGTGCIAIALAVGCPNVSLWATDVSPQALQLAQANAMAHRVNDRIEFRAGDAFEAVPPGLRVDLVISNPPYIPSGEIDALEPEVREHDPRLALDGGPDGLAFFRRLAAEAAPHLKQSGRLMMECGDDQAAVVAGILQHENWIVEPALRDYSDRERFLIAHRPTGSGAPSA